MVVIQIIMTEVTVCARVTQSFWGLQENIGNDLITPTPHFNFPGLKDGDQWCVYCSKLATGLQRGQGM